MITFPHRLVLDGEFFYLSVVIFPVVCLTGSSQKVINPSICSCSSGLTWLNMGSKIKSIPSLRASFAAGTKSLSPDIRTIRSTCFLYAREAISIPIFISTPFWSTSIEKSFSVKSENNFFSVT